jgi:hypothetical protein
MICLYSSCIQEILKFFANPPKKHLLIQHKKTTITYFSLHTPSATTSLQTPANLKPKNQSPKTLPVVVVFCFLVLLQHKEKKHSMLQNFGKLVGRAGFEPATARFLWPRQARLKPTMGRPLQLLRPLDLPMGSRALPG